MNYTDENITEVAQKIVEDMDLDDLISYVYDDLVALFEKDEELFNANWDCLDMDTYLEKEK
jgi:hypothetical protein